jgi:hypothetical protein
MEKVKKSVKRALKYESIGPDEGQIIPDLDVVYHFKVLLTSKMLDFGAFDTYVEPEEDEEPDTGDGDGVFVPPELPQVSTGIITEGVQFNILGPHTIQTDGNATITEYGVLVTYDPLYGTEINLRKENVGANIIDFRTQSVPATIPYSFTKKLLALEDFVYIRAYAKNSVGVGYGNVRSGSVIPGSLRLETTTTTTTTTIRFRPTGPEEPEGFVPERDFEL